MYKKRIIFKTSVRKINGIEIRNFQMYQLAGYNSTSFIRIFNPFSTSNLCALSIFIYLNIFVSFWIGFPWNEKLFFNEYHFSYQRQVSNYYELFTMLYEHLYQNFQSKKHFFLFRISNDLLLILFISQSGPRSGHKLNFLQYYVFVSVLKPWFAL